MDHYRDDQSTLRSSGSVSGSVSRSDLADVDMEQEEKENLLESGATRSHPSSKPKSRLAILSLPCTTFFLALSNVLLLAALVAITLRPITTTAAGTTAATPAAAASGTEQHPLKKYPEQPPWEPQVDFRTEIFRFQTIYGAEPSEEVEQAWTSMIPSKFSSCYSPWKVEGDAMLTTTAKQQKAKASSASPTKQPKPYRTCQDWISPKRNNMP